LDACESEPVEFQQAVRRRRMIRNYDPDRPIPRETVETLLNLAIRAPSAGYSQGWEFLVLTDITSRDAFWRCTADGPADPWLTGMQRAPVLVVCFSDKTAYLDRYAEPDKGWTDRSEAHWPVPYWHIDTGMAALILLLAATDAGLGACFFGVPPEAWPALRNTFAVPERLDPVGVVSIGYPAADRRSPSLRRGRRGAEQVTHYNSFATASGGAVRPGSETADAPTEGSAAPSG
jgi:nitroreductase